MKRVLCLAAGLVLGPLIINLNAQTDFRYNLDFEVPVTVKSVVLYRDGGTIGVTLRDGTPRDFEFCLDRSLRTKGNDNDQLIFIGATHWSAPEAKPVKKSSREEKALREVLETWVQRTVTSEDQALLLRAKGTAGLADRELKAYWVLQILKVLWYR